MAETALQGPTHFRDFDVHLKLLYKTNLYLGAQGWLALAFLSTTVGEPAAAEDLDSAIKAAAEFSPLLTSARSRLEGCAAEVTIARAEGLPTVNGTLRYSKELGKYPGAGDGFAAETSVNIPLFRGGSVRNGVKSSEAQCDASSASISEVESEVTLMLTKAYAEVITNRKIVTLNREAVTNLSAMLEGVQQRLRARDLTRTDVDQAQSRLSLARGRLETALAALESSDAEFQRLTGRKPADLLPLPSISGIPLTADAAIEIAVAENPGVIAARSEAQATRFSLNSAKGDLLPQVYATANSNYGETPQNSLSQGRYAFGTTVGVGMRMSFFAGGRQNAKVRTASARVTQAEQQVINLERSVSARMRSAYAEWVASRSLVAASRQAVAANESALNGVRMENAVGTRTILEILNAEQELRDAQIQLANAERDHLVASMAILAALGRAKAGIIQFDQSPVLQPEGTLQDSLPRPAFSSLMDSVSTAPRRSDPNLPPPSSQTSIPDVPKVDSVPALQPAVSWAVQLGAFDSLQAARSQWQIVSEHLPYSRRNGFEAAVFRIEIGGRTLFRLAALGPSDWAQAQHACLTFKAAGQTCLVKKASLLGERIWSAPAAREN